MRACRGGRTVYYGALGEHSSALVQYLSSIPDTKPLSPGTNPATWMLQVTGGSMAAGGDAAAAAERYTLAYADSALAAANRRAAEAARSGQAAGPGEVSAAGQELRVSTKYSQSLLTQLAVLSNKFRVIYWRKPDYNLMRFVMTAVIGIALGTTFFELGELPEPAELADVQNVLGVLFTSVSFMVRMHPTCRFFGCMAGHS